MIKGQQAQQRNQFMGAALTSLGDYTLLGAPRWQDEHQENRGRVTLLGKDDQVLFQNVPCGKCKLKILFTSQHNSFKPSPEFFIFS